MNNKILMSLLTASISALAVAPAFAEEGKLIDIANKMNGEGMSSDALAEKSALKEQVNAMLEKRASLMKISESINIIVENYGDNDKSIKQKVFEDLKLAQWSDSTNAAGWAGTPTVSNGTSFCHAACHTACHTACHCACHGARGWR